MDQRDLAAIWGGNWSKWTIFFESFDFHRVYLDWVLRISLERVPLVDNLPWHLHCDDRNRPVVICRD